MWFFSSRCRVLVQFFIILESFRTTFSGTGDEEFDKLIDTFGDQLPTSIDMPDREFYGGGFAAHFNGCIIFGFKQNMSRRVKIVKTVFMQDEFHIELIIGLAGIRVNCRLVATGPFGVTLFSKLTRFITRTGFQVVLRIQGKTISGRACHIEPTRVTLENVSVEVEDPISSLFQKVLDIAQPKFAKAAQDTLEERLKKFKGVNLNEVQCDVFRKIALVGQYIDYSKLGDNS